MTLTECADARNVNEIVESWPKTARESPTTMMEKYGPPNEACAGRLVWHNNGPWRHTVVYSEEVAHNFPAPHHDVLEQYIPYRAPADKFNDLAAFDGSVDRTKGEMSARCQGKASNFLALNVALEVIQGRKLCCKGSQGLWRCDESEAPGEDARDHAEVTFRDSSRQDRRVGRGDHLKVRQQTTRMKLAR